MLENPKGFPLSVFLTLRFFSENKNFSPFNFLMFCDRMDVLRQKTLSVFRHCETFFLKFFLSKGPPLNFFDVLQQIGCWKTLRVPLSVFRRCETFIRKFVFSPKGSPFNWDKNVDNFGSVPLLARQGLALAGPGAPLGPFFCVCNFFEKFSIFEYCKREYLTLGSLFAIFEPWIWRQLGPVPACWLMQRLYRAKTSSILTNWLPI